VPPALRLIADVLLDAWRAWSRHGTERQAAALAFYTLFSLAPILMVVTAAFGFVFGQDSVQAQLQAQLPVLVGPEIAATVLDLVQRGDRPGAQALTALVGFGTLLLAASRAFQQLQGALDAIWEAHGGAPARGAIQRTLQRRALAFGLVLSVGLFVLLSLVLGAVLEASLAWAAHWMPASAAVGPWVNDLTTLGVMTVAFGAIYRLLPSRAEDPRALAIGAVVTAALFTAGKHGIAAWLGRSGAGSAYGASGSLVVLLLWLYYSAMLVLGGAELTQAVARRLRPPAAP
jgi:membrane protein